MAERQTPEQHGARHVELHKALDELVADFIRHTDRMPSRTPLSDLMSWSFAQTLNPTELPNG
jgi:hypothetical protein